MRKLITLLLLLYSAQTNAQLLKPHYSEQELATIADSIVNEAMLLYRSEAASWYGTDIFLEKFKGDRENLGYFSYPDGITAKTVFFTSKPAIKVVGTITFDTTYAIDKGFANMQERDFTRIENEYYTIRNKALRLLETDTFFHFYNATGTNVVPIINNGRKDVYIITASKQNDMVILGNDYVIHFDKNNNVIGKERLHASIIPLKKPEEETVGLAHTHLPEFSPFMTVTDICTAKLYETITGWKNYTTVSENYISIWNGGKLLIVYYPHTKEKEK